MSGHSDPFNPANARRGVMRNGDAAFFWQCDEVCGFSLAGYFARDATKSPQMWREDGSWKLAEFVQSPYDLLLDHASA